MTKDSGAQTQYQLNHVQKIIAVSSAKGGVGKSTLAAHLAMSLAQDGYKVGLLDADLYGPSVPLLFDVENYQASSKNGLLQPWTKDHLKLMSFGFLVGKQSAILRGPMVGRYVKHLLTQTDWGTLDCLLIDFPPGTGDIPLTITQTIQLDGALIVTTPHQLALADVERGVQMFRRMRVPVLGIIENMAYAEWNGERQYIFGKLDQDKIEDDLDAKFIAHIPLEQTFSLKAFTQPLQTIKEKILQLPLPS